MKRVLILCTTCYQLIMAISMRLNNFNEDQVSVILTDLMSRKAGEVCRKLAQEGTFQNVYFINAKDRFCEPNASIIDKLVMLKDTIFNGGPYADIYRHEYDLFLYHHQDVFSMELFAGLQRKNSQIQCARFEEGIISYKRCLDRKYECGKLREWLTCSLRKCLHKPCLGDSETTGSFYCCYPEVYTGELMPIRVPFLKRNEEILRLLCYIFSIDETKLQYREKYIMLTSVLDFEGESPIGEFELAKKISELVDKEDHKNLLVKTHPRDTRSVYIDAGFQVDENSHIPWEIIQLVVDFSDKVLLTATSGSALSINMILEDPPQTFFLYELCHWQENSMAKESVEVIQKLLQDPQVKERVRHIHVVHDLNEILG